MATKYEQDPDAVLDYTVDWSLWLPEGDTIANSSWVSANPTLLIVDSSSFTDTGTTVWLSLGAGAVAGTRYEVTNHIVTAGGREEDRTLSIKVKQH
jgi:hypothetical protein